jgi:hypothetical protein
LRLRLPVSELGVVHVMNIFPFDFHRALHSLCTPSQKSLQQANIFFAKNQYLSGTPEPFLRFKCA